ncbi:MAG: nitrilase-related carbon-nitrogen hydrolase [Chlamydiota bacterium]|nr:nitrilase-related carbon-nitrogen hydrolase [Chlamydiota bacterium]
MAFQVALAQINPRLGDLDKNMALFEEQIALAIRKKARLIVFPELGLSGYFLRDMVSEVSICSNSLILKRLCTLSHKISIVFGAVEETQDVSFYNAAFYIEKGKLLHIHRKVYLPTYGMFDEQRYFARGKSARAFDTQFGRIAILNCEDLWHPSLVQLAVQDGARMIIAIASSPGRGVEEGLTLYSTQMWERMNRFYASLYGVFYIFVNRAGVEEGVNFWGGSEVIDPEGNVLIKSPYFDACMDMVLIDDAMIRQKRIVSPILREEDIHLTIAELERIRDKQSEPQSGTRKRNAGTLSKRRGPKDRL